MGEFQPYPSCRYHISGKTAVVNNPVEDEALRSGWCKSPQAFERYRGPRQVEPNHDPVRWVDQWPVDGLSESDRRKIKAQLKRAHSVFWKSPDDPAAEIRAMKLAFDGVARVLFDAGRLTEQLLAKDIPGLVWDAAMVGGLVAVRRRNPPDLPGRGIGALLGVARRQPELDLSLHRRSL